MEIHSKLPNVGTTIFTTMSALAVEHKAINLGQGFPSFPVDTVWGDLMKKHIDALKEPYKSVIEMREIKRMSYKDISDTLGKNLSTIKSQIRNGRAILVKETETEFKQLEEMYL